MANKMRDLEGKRRRTAILKEMGKAYHLKARKVMKAQKAVHADHEDRPSPSPSPSRSRSSSRSPSSRPPSSHSRSPSSPAPSSPSSSGTDEDEDPNVNPISNLQTPAKEGTGTDDNLSPHPVQVFKDIVYTSYSGLSRKNAFITGLLKYFELDQFLSGARLNPIIIDDSSKSLEDLVKDFTAAGTSQDILLVDGNAPTNLRPKDFRIVPSPTLPLQSSTHIFTVIFRGKEGPLSATFSTILTNTFGEFFNLSCNACGLNGYRMEEEDHMEISISDKSTGKKVVYSGTYRKTVWLNLMELIGLMPQSDVEVYFLDHVFV